MATTLNVGMVGYGFMARAHSNAWSKVSHFFDTGYRPVLKAVAARNNEKANAFAAMWGYESVESDWKKLIERKDIDVIDICTPNDSHAEIAIAAAKAGKMVTCEKPLARSTAEGLPMVEAVEKAGVPNMVWYNYRRVPAVSLIKQVVDQGLLGKIYHYRAKFLQDWTISPDVPQGGAATWRLDVDAAGSGVTGDLLAHCIDTALWINGDIKNLTAMTETFVKERKNALTGKMQKVGIDDAAAVLTHFSNGSLGTFESTRYARGHKAAYTLEINGENGSFAWDLHDLNRVSWFDHRTPGALRGWTSILVTDGEHPYLGKWWVPGLILGYEHSFVHQVADFLRGLADGVPAAPTFRDALATTMVCDAIINSGNSGQWVDVEHPDAVGAGKTAKRKPSGAKAAEKTAAEKPVVAKTKPAATKAAADKPAKVEAKPKASAGKAKTGGKVAAATVKADKVKAPAAEKTPKASKKGRKVK